MLRKSRITCVLTISNKKKSWIERKKIQGKKFSAQISLRFCVNCLCYGEEKQVLDVWRNAENRGSSTVLVISKAIMTMVCLWPWQACRFGKIIPCRCLHPPDFCCTISSLPSFTFKSTRIFFFQIKVYLAFFKCRQHTKNRPSKNLDWTIQFIARVKPYQRKEKDEN